MQSITEIQRDRFNFILNSKKLCEILTAYFNEPSNTKLDHLVQKHKDTFKYWVHESLNEISFGNFIKVLELLYKSPVGFEITGRRILTRDEILYGWVELSKDISIFIQWKII